MASIRRRVAARSERRATAPWRAKVTGPDGKQRSRSFERKVDAERWVVEQQSKALRGEWADPALGEERLGDFYVRWLERAKEMGYPAPSTLAKYETTWRVHVAPRLGAVRLASITRGSVEDAMRGTERASSAWQALEALKLIRVLLSRAVDEGALSRNVASRIKPPRIERTEPRVLTPDEVAGLVEYLPERFRALVLLDAYASLRWSELIALKGEDVDLEARTVRVDKTLGEVRGQWVWRAPKTRASARKVDLPNLIVKPLAAHLLRFPPLVGQTDHRRNGLIFYGERGGPIRRHSFRKSWDRACAAAGIEGMRVEWLRHSGASLAYLATRDLKAVAARLGHTSTRMADTVYVELYAETSRAVADAIDDLVDRSTLAQSWPNASPGSGG